GVAALDAGDKEEMTKQFEMALKVEPTHYESLLRLAFGLRKLGRTQQDFAIAAAACTGCIMRRPAHGYVHYLRSHAYVRLHRYRDALADVSKAIELDLNDPAAWNLRGWVHQLLNELDQALEDHAKAIKLHSTDPLFWVDRSVTYMKLGQWENALA